MEIQVRYDVLPRDSANPTDELATGIRELVAVCLFVEFRQMQY